MALKTSSDTAHWSEVAWMFSFFAKFFFSTMDFYGALSPGVIYIGHKLIRIIPISLISKYYYIKIMVISFRMLYHYTWNSKTNLNIVSSLDLNIISNKNDNHKHKHAHDTPPAIRAGGVLSSRFGWSGGQAGGCQICGTHISVTTWWIFSIRTSVKLSRPVVVHCRGHLPICPIWACPWAKNLSNQAALGPDFAERISLKPLDGFIPFEVLWNF